jgi:hypothetical protein
VQIRYSFIFHSRFLSFFDLCLAYEKKKQEQQLPVVVERIRREQQPS